jgi:hypothetical protein
VWGWTQKRAQDENGKRIGEYQLIPDLAQIEWQGREVWVVCDSDAATNQHVGAAMRQLAAVLAGEEAKVLVGRLPAGKHGTKVGLDDFIMGQGKGWLSGLAKKVRPPDLREIEQNPDSCLAAGCSAVAELPVDSGRRHAPFPCTDLANAERLVKRCGANLRYCPERGWLVWNGKYWEPDADVKVEQGAKETVKSIYEEAMRETDMERRIKLMRGAAGSERANRIHGMVDLAKSEPTIRVQAEQLDGDQWLLNVQNGTIDLKTGELREHSREDLITKCCNVTFDPTAKAPTWERFVAEVMGGNQELIGFVQWVVGYALTGDTSEQVLFFGSHPEKLVT